MNENKLKELEQKASGYMSGQGVIFSVDDIKDLITAYRQLEKDKDELAFNSLIVIKKLEEDKTELLAALEEIESIAVVRVPLSDRLKALFTIHKIAEKVYTKHKGE